MSLLDVAASDRRINLVDWGEHVQIISGINGEIQTMDALDSTELLKCIQLRYAHTETDTETGLQIISDKPVITLHYDSIDSALLGGIPQTETDDIHWAMLIPPQFNVTGELEPYIIYKVLRGGTLKDLKCYLRKADEEIEI